MFKINKLGIYNKFSVLSCNHFSFLSNIKDYFLKPVTSGKHPINSNTDSYVLGLEKFKIKHDVNSYTKIKKYDIDKKFIYYTIKTSPHQIFKIYDYYNPTTESIKLNSDISVLKINQLSREQILNYINKQEISEESLFLLFLLFLKVESHEVLMKLVENDNDFKNVESLTYEKYCSFKTLNDKKILCIRKTLHENKDLQVIYSRLSSLNFERYNRDSLRMFKLLSMTHCSDSNLWIRSLNHFSTKLDIYIKNSKENDYLPFMYNEIIDVFINIFDFLYYNMEILKQVNSNLDYYTEIQTIYLNNFDFLVSLFEECYGKFSGALVKFLALSTLLDINDKINNDTKTRFENFIIRLIIKDLRLPVFFLKTLEIFQIYYLNYNGNKNDLEIFKLFDEEFRKLTPYSLYIKNYMKTNTKMSSEEKIRLEEETNPKLLETEVLILESYDNSVYPDKFITKVLNIIKDNDFQYYEENILDFVILLKIKYGTINDNFDSKFKEYLLKKVDLIRNDIRLLFRGYILTLLDDKMPNNLAIKQYTIDGIKNYKNEKNILIEMKKELEYLKDKLKLENEEFNEIINQINEYLN